MGELTNRDLSGRVIEAAIRAHQILGPGFLESVYESALCVELERKGISFERQKVVSLQYEGHRIGEHRLDLLVEGVLLVELKAVREIEKDLFRRRTLSNESRWFGVSSDPQLWLHAARDKAHRPRAHGVLIS